MRLLLIASVLVQPVLCCSLCCWARFPFACFTALPVCCLLPCSWQSSSDLLNELTPLLLLIHLSVPRWCTAAHHANRQMCTSPPCCRARSATTAAQRL
jgi:hypothetical protein